MLGTTYIRVNRFINDELKQTYEKAICDVAEHELALVTYNGKIYIIDQNTGYLVGTATTISKARGLTRDLEFMDKLINARYTKDYEQKINELREFRNATID